MVRTDQDQDHDKDKDKVAMSKYNIKSCYVRLVDVGKKDKKKRRRRKVVVTVSNPQKDDKVLAALAVVEVKEAKSVEVEKSSPEEADIGSMEREVRLIEDENKAVNEVADAIALGTELTRQRIRRRKRKLDQDLEVEQERTPIVPKIIKKELRKQSDPDHGGEADQADEIKVFKIVEDDDDRKLCIDLTEADQASLSDEDRMRTAFDRAREERLANLKTKVSSFKKISLDGKKRKYTKRASKDENNGDEPKKKKKNPVVPRIISCSADGSVVKKSYYIPTGKPRGRPKGSGNKQTAAAVVNKQQPEERQQQNLTQQHQQQQEPGTSASPEADLTTPLKATGLKPGRPKGITFPARLV